MQTLPYPKWHLHAGQLAATFVSFAAAIPGSNVATVRMIRRDQIERICDVSPIIPSTRLTIAVRPTSDVIDSTNHRFGCIVPAPQKNKNPNRRCRLWVSSLRRDCGSSGWGVAGAPLNASNRATSG
jgi:hypothetical protein